MKKFFIYTFGCQMNKYDSQKMGGQLAKAGWGAAGRVEEADVVIVNTCSVREKAETRAAGRLHLLKSLKKKNPGLKIVVAGCTAQYHPEYFREKTPFVDLVIGTFNEDRILELLQEIEKTPTTKEKLAATSQPSRPADLCFDIEFEGPPRDESYVAIMNGCNNFCAYCVVPLARGPEISRPLPDILSEIKKIDFTKYPRLVLLGQNVNSYRWNDHDFSDLLVEVEKIAGPEIIEFLTSHPKDTSDKLIKTIKNRAKISRTIHLPLQSGDDQILKMMNRHYTLAEYVKLIEKIRREIPEVKISTDIIVGFPGETEDQFQNTMEALTNLGFSRINAAAYSSRPKTAAAALPGQLPPAVKARRLQIVLAFVAGGRHLDGQKFQAR